MATRQERIDWLLAHQNLWEGWRAILPGDERKPMIIERMREAGLYSDKTGDCDIHLVKLINLARKQRRARLTVSR